MYLHVIVYHHSLVSKPEEKEEKGRVFSHLSMCLTGIIEDEAVHLHTHTHTHTIIFLLHPSPLSGKLLGTHPGQEAPVQLVSQCY